ncbi:hypothetical protein LPMP_080590 [Leishmania panamensis]|uniref:Uncharacterized protein n=1 Tax=Leishmania panamensis TaxID=5679 RepID=A0A088RIY9_LEIPA|nr:hypothetical protein LPMP_080590 [Leishmania panamensis]AIN95868.1 hypothetical protein LPMP_080590 [Leishmania panamensis]
MAFAAPACTRASSRSRTAFTRLCLTALWCVLCMGMRRETMAVAQGSASAETGTCSYTIWTTTPPPLESAPVVYPPGALAYQPQNHTIPSESFFRSYWYVAITLILCVVCGFYILLAALIIYHFSFYAQQQAQKVVMMAYLTEGYFHLDGKEIHGGRTQTRVRSGARAPSSCSSSLSRQPSDSYDHGNSPHDDRYGSVSPSSSLEADDTVTQMNPLQR